MGNANVYAPSSATADGRAGHSPNGNVEQHKGAVVPTITTRTQWGAAPPRHAPIPTRWQAGGVLWVHYSDGPAPASTVNAEVRTVAAIQRFHQGPARGWSDIGYAYLVAPSGRIYEGRGRDVVAAHCPGHNSEASVCLLWKSATELPPQPALDSVLWLRDHLGMATLKGHREGTSTACPGNAIFSWVVAHRTKPPPKPVAPAATAVKYPWTATSDGKLIGSGRFYPPTIRFIQALVAAGKTGATITLKYNK